MQYFFPFSPVFFKIVFLKDVLIRIPILYTLKRFKDFTPAKYHFWLWKKKLQLNGGEKTRAGRLFRENWEVGISFI